MGNKRSARSSDEGDQLARAKARADAAWRATQDVEKEWFAAAKLIRPEEWRRVIDGIADSTVRIQVACLIWYDQYSTRAASDAWHDLDGYLAAWTADLRADPRRVREALIMIGYPVRLAERRVKIDEPKITVSRGNRRVKRWNK